MIALGMPSVRPSARHPMFASTGMVWKRRRSSHLPQLYHYPLGGVIGRLWGISKQQTPPLTVPGWGASRWMILVSLIEELLRGGSHRDQFRYSHAGSPLAFLRQLVGDDEGM